MLDHFVIFGERHLRYLVQQFVEHYGATVSARLQRVHSLVPEKPDRELAYIRSPDPKTAAVL